MLLSCCSCLSPTMETSCQHVITLWSVHSRVSVNASASAYVP
jgi:hypothetical protein